jgi:precorrin-8X/cobalt-precorrin-8 methylmutase
MEQQTSLNHPIIEESFAIIDREVGEHSYSQKEYQVIRRVIHATADFGFLNLLTFSDRVLENGMIALKAKTPIIVDVGMVKQGIQGMVQKTFQNPIICALEKVKTVPVGNTRTATGILNCFAEYPQGIYVIGNAPTALLSLCKTIKNGMTAPSLIIGAPVGFVSVIESKNALSEINVPKIIVQGRKGGSSVAAAIINALLVLSYEET